MFFLSKTNFCHFNKQGILRTEENVILCTFQHQGVLMFLHLINIVRHIGEWDTTLIIGKLTLMADVIAILVLANAVP